MSGLTLLEWGLVGLWGLNIAAVLFWLAAQTFRPRRLNVVEQSSVDASETAEPSAESRMSQDIRRWREQNGLMAMPGDGR